MPDEHLLKHALQYAALGWHILPLKSKSKQPATEHGAADATDGGEQIRRWWKRWPTANIGVNCGASGLLALDLDAYKDGFAGADLLTRGERETVTAITGSGGEHLLYRMPEGERLGNHKKGLPAGIDVRGWNGYLVLPPSIHPDTGRAYQWEDGYSPFDVEPRDLPVWLAELLRAAQGGSVEPVAFGADLPKPDLRSMNLPRWAERRVFNVDPVEDRSESDYAVVCELVRHGQDDDAIRGVFQNYPIGTAGKYAEKNGQGDHYLAHTIASARSDVAAQPERNNGAEPDAGDTKAHDFTLDDVGNGQRFAHANAARFRYTTGTGWLAWDTHRWLRDVIGDVDLAAKAITLDMMDHASTITNKAADLRKAAAEPGLSDDERTRLDNLAGKESARAATLMKWARQSRNRQRIDAMKAMAESEPPIARRDEDFDRDPWLLNCTNGTLDLHTGDQHPHDPHDMLTTLCPTAFDPASECPTWELFLWRVFAGNGDLIGFLRRLVGYSLTGSTQEHILPMLYGSGANGKSTFVDALMHTLGEDFASSAPPDLLMAKAGERHPTELAALRGKRLVVASETEEGRRLNEVLAKILTGGDKITARFMRQDFFTFAPTHKLWIVGNHKPVVRGTDYAIWRRIRLIPFTVTIPESERDVTLGEKLRSEAEGILAWAVRGCLEWQAHGLKAPPEVLAATNEYRAESDTLGLFLDECTVSLPAARSQASHLYAAYQKWALTGGIHPVTMTHFGRALGERGFEKVKARTHIEYVGIGLLPE
jgi:putative DNA primase/helicase